VDTFSRKVVGWSIDSSWAATLVTNALGMSIGNRTPGAGTVIHSDSECGRVPVFPRFLTLTAMDAAGCWCQAAPGLPDPHSDRRLLSFSDMSVAWERLVRRPASPTV
jgi:hypothetical protein